MTRTSRPGTSSAPRRTGRLAALLFGLTLVFLYTYNFPYFAGINSANELPRIYQTLAIVDRGALDIGPEMQHYPPTPDTAAYKDKLYPNKAPGMSFINVPVYWVLKKLHGDRPELIELFFWFRLFGSIIPSLLFLILMHSFLGAFAGSPENRRLLLAAYALGTMALTYGTLLIAHQLSGLLMACGYILLFRQARGLGGRASALLAGLAAGSGVLVDYQVAFIGPPLFIYALSLGRPRLRTAVHFAVGAAVPLGILLLYQWAVFESPLRTGYHYVTNPTFQDWHGQGFLGMKAFNSTAFFGSFFRSDNGLFYFSPFLLLALPGLVLMLRRRDLRADGIFCLVLILFFAYFISSLTFWRSGWAVGPRYITCALPYYMVPVAVLLGHLEGKRWPWRVIPVGLMGLSILLYTTSNAVFPHYPENFSNPWFDLTLRFGRAGYVAYNLGWLLGWRGLLSALPYLIVLGVLLAVLLSGGAGRLAERLRGAVLGLLIMAAVLGFYYTQLSRRWHPVPVDFLPWMERIWEPRHSGMDLMKVMPAGDPTTGDLSTKTPWWQNPGARSSDR